MCNFPGCKTDTSGTCYETTIDNRKVSTTCMGLFKLARALRKRADMEACWSNHQAAVDYELLAARVQNAAEEMREMHVKRQEVKADD